MTSAVYKYVENQVHSSPQIRGRVLEIGSYDVNGSVRPIFQEGQRFSEYIGLDMRPGPGVDVVAFADQLPYEAGRFEVVVCAEMLEHDARFWISLQEIRRVLIPGGYLILTTRNIGFPRHDYPSDYWRFTADGLKQLFESVGMMVVNAVDDMADQGTFGCAVRV